MSVKEKKKRKTSFRQLIKKNSSMLLYGLCIIFAFIIVSKSDSETTTPVENISNGYGTTETSRSTEKIFVNYCKEYCDGIEGVKCTGDPYKFGAFKCVCPNGNEHFDYNLKKCLVEESACNAKCLDTGGACVTKTNEIVVCVCPEGTTYDMESGCKVSENVCREKTPNCLETGGFCESENDRLLKCICQEGTMYYWKHGCVVERKKCNKEHPKCMGTGGSCKLKANKTIICNCPTSTAYENGKGCQVTDTACNTKLPKCLSSDGFCKLYRLGEIRCECPKNRQYDIETGCKDPCRDNLCLNGGTCFVVNGMFRCACADTFTGDRCEKGKTDSCRGNPCLNGGTCSGFNDTFKCDCDDTFLGERCEIDLADPCRPNPCLNGGMCFAYNDTFKCGAYIKSFKCSRDIAKKVDMMVVFHYSIIGLLILLIAVISCASFCWCKNRVRDKNAC